MSQKQTPEVPSWFIPIIIRLIITIEKTKNKWIFADQKPSPKKSAHSKKMFHIRSAKSAPAIEFDADDEVDEKPRLGE